jgi:hypothetical protein
VQCSTASEEEEMMRVKQGRRTKFKFQNPSSLDLARGGVIVTVTVIDTVTDNVTAIVVTIAIIIIRRRHLHGCRVLLGGDRSRLLAPPSSQVPAALKGPHLVQFELMFDHDLLLPRKQLQVLHNKCKWVVCNIT